MIESRAIISNIKETKEKIEKLGGVFKNDYAFKDIIFIPKDNGIDLSGNFLRLRILSKNNWPTKNAILIKKRTEFKKIGKTDDVAFRKEFDTEKESLDFIKNEVPEFKFGFDYSREGWEYELEGHRVFIEDIKGFKPSIEIEADSEVELKELLNKIGFIKLLKESVPKTISRIKKNGTQ